MYINFWYPIGTSEEIAAGEPHRVRILGLNFVAFRDSKGRPHVLSDTCVHRGGSLSKGWLKGDCVVCPYHGWEYGGDGKCQTVPSIGYDGKPPARAKVDSYPVEEKYGLVFAFLGDLPEAERPPLYEIEEYGQDGWRAHDMIILDTDFYYERSLENGLDPAHNEFVHPAQGFPTLITDDPKKPIKVTDIPWGSKFKLYFEVKNKDTELGDIRAEKFKGWASSWHYGPNTLVTWIQFSEHNGFHQYFFEAPIDESHTRIYFINLRNCMLEPENDDTIRKVNLQVTKEDVEVLNDLNPMRTPETNTKEILMPTDQASVRYREILKTWEHRGWRIDVAAMKEKSGDVACAIPCPDRRVSGNWVLDEVPLLPAAQQSRAAAE